MTSIATLLSAPASAPAVPRAELDAGCYSGGMLLGARHGKGRLWWGRDRHALKYTGEWREGQRCGRGQSYDAQGRLAYEGGWLASLFEGQGVQYDEARRVSFRGAFVAGLRHGQGTLFVDGQQRYKGAWLAGELEGAGVLARHAPGMDQLTHVGAFSRSMRHGKGVTAWHELHGGVRRRVVLDGDWVEDRFEGSGASYTGGIKTFEGCWRASVPHGVGTRFFEDGSVMYEGEHVDGRASGSGTARERTGVAVSSTHRAMAVYRGRWLAGMREGPGRAWFASKIEYEGGWRRDKHHGRGALFYADGTDQYRGDFRDGQRHGQGTHTSVCRAGQRAVYVGAWLDDLPHGKGDGAFASADVDWRHWTRPLLTQKQQWLQPLPPPVAAECSWAYWGQWQRGLRHGVGVVRHDGAEVYKGQFQAGHYHGRGLLRGGTDLLRAAQDDIEQYEGQFVAGQRQGHGRARTHNGSVYAGEWLAGEPHGAGELQLAGQPEPRPARFEHGVLTP